MWIIIHLQSFPYKVCKSVAQAENELTDSCTVNEAAACDAFCCNCKPKKNEFSYNVCMFFNFLTKPKRRNITTVCLVFPTSSLPRVPFMNRFFIQVLICANKNVRPVNLCSFLNQDRIKKAP